MKKIFFKVYYKLIKYSPSNIALYLESCFLRRIMENRKLEIIFRDKTKILIKRHADDNFFYLLKNNSISDNTEMIIKLSPYFSNFDVVVDAGANIGITSIWFSKFSKKVYAFEPEPKNLNLLKQNLDLNKVHNVITNKTALSDFQGKTSFNIMKGHGHHSIGRVQTSKFLRKIKVSVTTLDSFYKKKINKNIDLLKIDVEGYELEVIKGAEKLLKKNKIKRILFELSEGPLKSLNKKPNSIIDYLLKYNFYFFDFDFNKLTKEEIIENYLSKKKIDVLASHKSLLQ